MNAVFCAVIRPMTTHPHTKNVKKHDPVSRYQQYKDNWTSQRAPGEKHHSGLRWNVREQMLHHDQVIEKVITEACLGILLASL